ncbi:HEPN/Toprim-associated domain-containing protein [Nonomuraea sp. NPDC055795]
MGHYSYLMFGEHRFFWARDGYDSNLAALFSESERRYVPAEQEGADEGRYGYFTTAMRLRQRLHLQGFTAARARADLEEAVRKWRGQRGGDDREVPERRQPRSVEELLEDFRHVIAGGPAPNYFDVREAQRSSDLSADFDELGWFAEVRSLARLLLEFIPDEWEVGLDLAELTGCCVEMDPHQSVAAPARAAQLASIPLDAPLIVLTEGRTDSGFLAMAMAITHPHLVGFVNFIDFAGTNATEGSVSVLARTVSTFIAAGVANRFVAIADNDTAAHAELAKLKTQTLPPGCRVIHYPDLPFLSSYPTLGPYSHETMQADVNGRAGSIEMYLGCDVLTIGNHLAPVQWTSYDSKLKRYQGALLASDKRAVHSAFNAKVAAARSGAGGTEADWSGVHAIIESVVHAFD